MQRVCDMLVCDDKECAMKKEAEHIYNAWCDDVEYSSIVGCLLCPWDARVDGGIVRLGVDGADEKSADWGDIEEPDWEFEREWDSWNDHLRGNIVEPKYVEFVSTEGLDSSAVVCDGVKSG
jgi:hypothetical protein